MGWRGQEEELRKLQGELNAASSRAEESEAAAQRTTQALLEAQRRQVVTEAL